MAYLVQWTPGSREACASGFRAPSTPIPPLAIAPVREFLMRLVLGLTALLSVLAFAAAGGNQRPVDLRLRLNELLAGPARDWDGSGTFSSRDDEWVEVRNPGLTPLDVSGYVLTDGDSIPRYAFSGSLAAEERRVVYGRDAYAWERAHGFPAFGLSLANAGDAVLLWQVVGPDTLLVDAYTYRSHEAAADRAVGRLNDSGEWALFDGLNPYAGTVPPFGTACSPSPGALNACSASAAKSVTWGSLKAMYR